MIKFLDLQKINLQHQQEIEEAMLNTFRSGWYIQGYVTFGDYCRLHSNVHIGQQSSIGSFVFIFPM
jgi:UDP-3-O-[3-hydroxymyristoyl] glucosamine N-acyltransferase